MEYNLGRMQNNFSLKRLNFENQLDTIEILVLGNSHTLYGIQPSVFKQRTFNLSSVSQTLYYDSEITLKYLPKLKKLKTVIINLSYFSLAYELHQSPEQWREYSYTYFWDINNPEMDQHNIKRYSLFYLYTPTLSLNFFLNHFKDDLVGSQKYDGSKSAEADTLNCNLDSINGQIRVRSFEKYFTDKNISKNTQILDHLISELIKNNIKPILLTTPVYSTFSNYTNPKFIISNIEIIGQLQKKYNVSYHNYLKDPRFLKCDFSDYDHLNINGANKLSKIITSEVL